MSWLPQYEACPICWQQFFTGGQDQARTNCATQATADITTTVTSDRTTTAASNPTIEDGGAINCPICKEPLIEPTTTICAHTFCSGCLTSWTENDPLNTCPTCRRNLTPYNQGYHDELDRLSDDEPDFEPYYEADFEPNGRRELEPDYRRQAETNRQSQNERQPPAGISPRNALAWHRLNALEDSFSEFEDALEYFVGEIRLGRQHRGNSRSLLSFDGINQYESRLIVTGRSISRIQDIIQYESRMFQGFFTVGPEADIHHLSRDAVEEFHLALLSLTDECTWLANQLRLITNAYHAAHNSSTNRQGQGYEVRFSELNEDFIAHISAIRRSIVRRASANVSERKSHRKLVCTNPEYSFKSIQIIS